MEDFATQFIAGHQAGRAAAAHKQAMELAAEDHKLNVQAHKLTYDHAKLQHSVLQQQIERAQATTPVNPPDVPGQVQAPMGALPPSMAGGGVADRIRAMLTPAPQDASMVGPQQPQTVAPTPMAPSPAPIEPGPSAGTVQGMVPGPQPQLTIHGLLGAPDEIATRPTHEQANAQVQAAKQAADTLTFNDPISQKPVTIPKEGISAYMTARLKHPDAHPVTMVDENNHKIIQFVDPTTGKVTGKADLGATSERPDNMQQQMFSSFIDKGGVVGGKQYSPDAVGFKQWQESFPANRQQISISLQKGMISDAALDQAAQKYASTGQMDSNMGRNGVMAAMVRNRAAELHPVLDLAGNKANFVANQESLKKLTSQRDAVVAFENTAGKNLDLFLQTAKPVVDSGIPLINIPLRKAAALAGGPNQAAFNAARQVALTEIAKTVSNPGLSGQLSDSARKEVESLVPESASLKQIVQVAEVLRKDMANRLDSYDEQIKGIQQRIGASVASPGNHPAVGGVLNGKKITAVEEIH